MVFNQNTLAKFIGLGHKYLKILLMLGKKGPKNLGNAQKKTFFCRRSSLTEGSKKVGEGIANGFYLKLDHLRFVVDGHCNGDKSGT